MTLSNGGLKLKLKMRVKIKFFTTFTVSVAILRYFYKLFVKESFHLTLFLTGGGRNHLFAPYRLNYSQYCFANISATNAPIFMKFET